MSEAKLGWKGWCRMDGDENPEARRTLVSVYTDKAVKAAMRRLAKRNCRTLSAESELSMREHLRRRGAVSER